MTREKVPTLAEAPRPLGGPLRDWLKRLADLQHDTEWYAKRCEYPEAMQTHGVLREELARLEREHPRLVREYEQGMGFTLLDAANEGSRRAAEYMRLFCGCK